MKDNLQGGRLSAAGAITTVAFASIVVLSLVFSVANTIINEIVDEFELVGTEAGLMGSMMSIGTMLALLVIPAAQGRTKKIPTLIFSCAAMAVFLYAASLSPGFAFFCAVCVLIGGACGFIDTYGNSCVVDARGKESPRYLGYLHGLFGVGSLVAPLAIYRLLTHTGWRGIYVGAAAIALLSVPLMYLLTRGHGKGEIHASTTEERLRLADIKGYLKQTRNVTLSAATFFSVFVQAGILMWVMRYMAVQFDAEALGALSLSVYWICATFTRFFLSHIINKAPMKFFVLGAVLSCVFIVAGVIADNAVVMCVMIGATGLASGHFIPVAVSENARALKGKTTFATSIIMFVMGIARIITPLVMAFISVRVSMATSMVIPAAAALIAALFGLAAIRAGRAGHENA